MHDINLLREDAVRAMTGLPKSTLHEARKAGLFPAPVRIGERSVAYPSNEVQAVIRARVAGTPDEGVRALVESLHAARQQLA